MKKLFFLFVALTMGILASAQTQQGYVKTKGRMDAKGNLIPGQGLKGATVSIQGRTTVLVKADDGVFSFPVTESQFRVDSVRKKGYQLVDMDALAKTYRHSSNPIYLVMETPEQQLQDKLNAERKIRRNLQKQLQEKEDEIENLKAKQHISDEEYRSALQKLYQDQENNEQLIKDMAKRYSELDYDQLDEFYQQVSYCIENGKLVKADSLLRTRGDITAQVDDILQRGQIIQQEKEQIQKAEVVQQADIDEAARRCYSYYETFKAQHLNDTAAYYLELRASLDTTNVEWQTKAGLFIQVNMADYGKALSYYSLALRQSLLQNEEKSEWTASCYNNIGGLYGEIGNHEKAMEYYGKALNINRSLFGENHLNVALNYHNIGSTYFDLGNYDKAMEYYGKALDSRKAVDGENRLDIASSYNCIGSVYAKQGNYAEALEYFRKALLIQKSELEENHPDVATIYNNIGFVYSCQGDFSKAIEYNNKALAIRKSIFGENHPDVATCYNNIGNESFNLGDYDTALEYCEKALTIRKALFGEVHPDVALLYSNIGEVYAKLGNYDKALDYQMEALSIRKAIFGEVHPYVAETYGHIAVSHHALGSYGKALECFSKSQSILEITLGENHPEVGTLKVIVFVLTNSYYEQALERNTIVEFAKDCCFTITINEGETSTSQQGIIGEYILLEFGEWNQDSPISIFEINAELKGKPKDILVMKDGIISKHHFENIIGAQLGVKYIGKEEKQRINKAYEEWKAKNSPKSKPN